MEFKTLSIEEYNKELQAKKSTPGGGSALAITLSIAISLCKMVISFTIDKKGYEEYHDKLVEMDSRLDMYLLKAYKYADLDSSTFRALMEAFKSKDEERIESASIDACMIPFNLFELTQQVHNIADELFQKANKNVISDAKIASDLCYSIYPGCVLNIKANIVNIHNEEARKFFNKVLF